MHILTKLFSFLILALPLTGLTAQETVELDTEAPVAINSGDLFGGFSARDKSWIGYIGASYAMNADKSTSGWIVKSTFGYGEYDYAAGNITVNAEFSELDALLGYQSVSDNSRLSFSFGSCYANHDLSEVDLNNTISGDEWGLKGEVFLSTKLFDHYEGSVLASYSTSFESYWARACFTRYVQSGLSFAPELIFMGNEGDWEEQRYGISLGGLSLGQLSVSLSSGWSDAKTEGGTDQDSLYGSIHVALGF